MEPAPEPYAAAAPPAAAVQPTPYAPSYAPAAPTQGLSITSMITGIVGLLASLFGGWGLLISVAAVVTGHMAVKRQPTAKLFWLTGVITGWAGIGIALIWVIFWVVFIIAIIGASMSYNYTY